MKKLLAFFFIAGLMLAQVSSHASVQCSGVMHREKQFKDFGMATLNMNRKYLGEENGIVIWNDQVTNRRFFKVKYLTTEELQKYQVFVVDGRLVNRGGQFIDTTQAQSGQALYVVDALGNFYISNHSERGVFHHSSLSSGKPVFLTGTIKVVEGRISFLTNDGGHYQTPNAYLKRFGEMLTGLRVTDFHLTVQHERSD